MKTAEEWATDINGIKWLDNSHPTMTNVVKQIQLDAMKEGMRRAANVTLNISAAPVSRKLIKDEIKEAILTAAEQLTEKDL